MKMTKLALVLAFLVVMAAGAVVGMAVDRQLRAEAEPPRVEPPHTRPSGPAFPKISPEQKSRIDEIWSAVEALRIQRFQLRHELDTKRSQDILALLSPEQKVQYEAIQTQYRLDVQKLEQNLQDAVHKAEEQTRAVLTDEQRIQYDKWRLHMADRRGGPGRNGPGRGGPGRGGPPRGMRSHPTTSPATMPSNAAGAQ
jgi:hypothetical protein